MLTETGVAPAERCLLLVGQLPVLLDTLAPLVTPDALLQGGVVEPLMKHQHLMQSRPLLLVRVELEADPAVHKFGHSITPQIAGVSTIVVGDHAKTLMEGTPQTTGVST